MIDTSYRAGINLETAEGRAVFAGKLTDPTALASAIAERDFLQSEDNAGQIFLRCYVSKKVHDELSTAIAKVTG